MRGAIIALAASAFALGTLAATARAQDAARPYEGLETREIKALSAEEIAALRAGEGMGYALAAELNHYPGPRHVLDLADSLGLSAEQRAGVEAAREGMRARALVLGDSLIAAEAALDSAFASATIDEAGLERRVAEIARLEGALRATHLAAHLVTRRLLTPAQVERYDGLRGYVAGADHGAADHDHEPDD